MKKIPLEYGKYYHIFNRGNNGDNLFTEKTDYLKFLEYYDIFTTSIADTYAWCLMKNHFHVLVRIKEEHEIGFLNSDYANHDDLSLKWKTTFPDNTDKRFTRKPLPGNQFKNLFGAYALWFKYKYERSGSLFEKNYERKWVDSQQYYRNLIIYIHQNPVKHGLVQHTLEYPWTSYLTIPSHKPTRLKRKEVLELFDSVETYTFMHNQYVNESSIEHLIIE